MKIITWNCNMAFRNKVQLLTVQQPDLLVIPECEHPDKIVFPGDYQPSSKLWFGSNLHKGLGIFSFGSYSLKLRRTHEPAFRMVVPVQVKGPGISLGLYAIWANNPDDPDGAYVEQVWKAINHYKKHLKNTNTLLVGDFNSNTIWDRQYRKGNHSHVVEFLEKKGIHSCYHHHHKQKQGKEKHPTLYMYRHKDKPYHIDYCFVSEDLVGRINSVEVGDFRTWVKYSDHVPIVISFNPNHS